MNTAVVKRDPDDHYRQQAQVLKALAHVSRLKIVDRLARGPCSVGDLTVLVGSDRTTVSKHLAVLRAHGIVRDQRAGNAVFYALRTACVTNFFDCAAQLLAERAETRPRGAATQRGGNAGAAAASRTSREPRS